MASAPKPAQITPGEYLARERLAETRSEYHDGRVFAMSGASRPHNLIAVNLTRALANCLLDRPCELYASEMRVRVVATNSYVYPDLVVACEEPRFEDGVFDTLLNPSLVVEILSPSTESWDRGGKFDEYRRLESLRDYVLVSQDRVRLEHHSLQGGTWIPTEYQRIEDTLRLPSVGCELTLRDVYAKVRWAPRGPGPAG